MSATNTEGLVAMETTVREALARVPNLSEIRRQLDEFRKIRPHWPPPPALVYSTTGTGSAELSHAIVR